MTQSVRLTIWVRGHVQGVGFRWWARARGSELGLAGTATNLEDGRVEIVVEGDEDSARAMLDDVHAAAGGRHVAHGPPGRVTGVTERWGDPRGLTGFDMR